MTKRKLDTTRTHQTYKTLSGRAATGVTTALSVINKPALLNWAWECGRDGLDYRKVKDKAASIGTLAHFMIECHVKGETPDTSEFSQADIDAATISFSRFLKFWQDGKFKIIKSEEQITADAMPPFGGTLDIVAERGDGAVCLIDIKTSKGIYDEMLFQLAAYIHLWNFGEVLMVDGEPTPRAIPIRRIEHTYIVRIGKQKDDDGEIRQLGNLENHFMVFQSALRLHWQLKDIKKGAGK